MAVVGVWAKDMFDGEPRGTVNTEDTFLTPPQKFNPPANILAVPVLQFVGETGDQSSARAFVHSYVEDGVTHAGPLNGVAAKKCSSITWALYTKNCAASALRLIFFLG